MKSRPMWRWLWVVLVAASGACSNAAVPPDGSTEPVPLDASTPGLLLRADGETGGELQVVAGMRAEVPVQLLSGEGTPLADVPVRFSLEGNTEGATLGNPVVATDADGIARAELNPGAAPAFFRLRAEADNAQPLVLDVTVSDSGFATVAVDLVPAGQGPGALPSPGSFAGVRSIQVRLYHLRECSAINAAMPPTPVRSPDEVNDTSARPELVYVLALDEPADATVYSILSTATDLSGDLVASGCVTLTGRELASMPPGMGPIDIVLPLVPVLYRVSASYRVSSSLRLDANAPVLREALAPLEALATCPATRLLDCLLDAQSEADPADCVPADEDDTPLARAVQRTRPGASGEHGCRTDAHGRDGGDSLDLLLAELLAADPEQTTRLDSIVHSALGAISTFGLESRLMLYPPSVDGVALFDHVVDRIDLTSGAIGKSYPAASFGEMSALGAAARYVAPLTLALGSHSFRLDYAKLAAAGLADLALSGHGASTPAELTLQLLGTLQPEGAEPEPDGAIPGCSQLAELVCERVGVTGSCAPAVMALCERLPEQLASSVDQGLLVLGASANTLTLSGDTVLFDGNGDVTSDGFGSGSWTGQLSTPAGPLEVTGRFTGLVAP